MLGKIVVTYGGACIITSLYIYITIIASPALILLFLRCTSYGRTDQYFEAFKAFPWIGINTLILRGSQNATVREGYVGVCQAMISYFLIMYFIYYIIIMRLTEFFFDQSMESGVAELLFGYLAVVEFAALIFMRTRPFIKYFPILNSLNLIAFLLYCEASVYGFKFYAMLAVQFFGIAMFSSMMLKLEIPALTKWAVGHPSIPTIKQPRSVLFPAFNLAWINGLPEEWTLLIPLVGRCGFSEN